MNSKELKLKKIAEAVLFMAGAPVGVSELSKILKISPEEARVVLNELKKDFAEKGVIITESGDSFQMATNPQISNEIKNYLEAQLREKLTEAAVETLSI